MWVLLVCGDARPRLDGVADYVTRLAAHLPAYDVEPLIGAAGAVAAPHACRLAPRWTLRGTVVAGRAIRLDDGRLVAIEVAQR